MSYCRYCGVEIAYKRTKNDKWMPCNAVTGEPHFCNEQKDGKEQGTKESGILPCPVCGKPTFQQKNGRRKILYDYSTLDTHKCKNVDITRYSKYKEKQQKLYIAAGERKRRKY